jgi:hypothetical protein
MNVVAGAVTSATNDRPKKRSSNAASDCRAHAQTSVHYTRGLNDEKHLAATNRKNSTDGADAGTVFNCARRAVLYPLVIKQIALSPPWRCRCGSQPQEPT